MSKSDCGSLVERSRVIAGANRFFWQRNVLAAPLPAAPLPAYPLNRCPFGTAIVVSVGDAAFPLGVGKFDADLDPVPELVSRAALVQQIENTVPPRQYSSQPSCLAQSVVTKKLFLCQMLVF